MALALEARPAFFPAVPWAVEGRMAAAVALEAQAAPLQRPLCGRAQANKYVIIQQCMMINVSF